MKTDIIKTYFTSRDGTRFYIRRAKPDDAKASVILVHGLGEHSGRYTHVIQGLVDFGFAVTAYDQRGHGKSDGSRGDIDKAGTWISDLNTIIAETKRSFAPKIPVFVLGHSLGGLIAINYAAQYGDEIAGTIASAPALGPTVEVSPLKMWIGKKVVKYLPKLQIGAEINPSHLSKDQTVVTEYVNDPLILKKISLRAGHQILDMAANSESVAYGLSCPVFLLQAKGDKICSHKVTQSFYEKIIHPNKQFLEFEGDFHEPFNDHVKEDAITIVAKWMGSVLNKGAQEEFTFSLKEKTQKDGIAATS